jgi:hypothetical protein
MPPDPEPGNAAANLSFRLVEALVLLNRNLELVSRQLAMLEDLPQLLKAMNGKLGEIAAPLSDLYDEIALYSRALEILDENLPEGKAPKAVDFFNAWVLADGEEDASDDAPDDATPNGGNGGPP